MRHLDDDTRVRLQELLRRSLAEAGQLLARTAAPDASRALLSSTALELGTVLGAAAVCVSAADGQTTLELAMAPATAWATVLLTARSWPAPRSSADAASWLTWKRLGQAGAPAEIVLGWEPARAGSPGAGLGLCWLDAAAAPASPPPELGALTELLVGLLGAQPTVPAGATPQLLRTLAMLVRGLAHDLATPVAVITSALWTLQQRAGTSASARELVTDLTSSASRIADVVAELRAVADERRPVPSNVTTDVERALDAVEVASAQMLRRGARVTRTRGEPAFVASDLATLTCLLTVLVRVSCRLGARIEAGCVDIMTGTGAGDGDLVVCIGNDGGALAPEVAKHLFDPFLVEQSLGSTSSLGLWACQNLVAGLHGQLRVETEGAAWTRFVLTLPRVAAPTRRKILLVDSDRVELRNLARSMGDDYEVLTALSGTAALAHLAREPDLHLVLASMTLLGCSGDVLHQQISLHAPALEPRLYFLVGEALSPALAAFSHTVSSRLLYKPVNADAVKQLLDELPR